MTRKKMVAWILTFSMIIQSPTAFLNMGIQTVVEAAEIIQTDESTEENLAQSETEAYQLQSEAETVQLQSEAETLQLQGEEKTVQKEIQGEQKTEQLKNEEQMKSVTLMLALEEPASTTYPFTLADLTYTDSDGVLTVTISHEEDFIKLSHCDPATIQNAELDIQISGSITLTQKSVVKGEETYFFAGIGSEAYPFSGAFKGQSITIGTDQPLFQAVMSSVKFNNNKILWEGKVGENEQGLTQKPVFAERYQFRDTEEYDFSEITIQAQSGNDVVMGPLIGEICGENGTLTIGNNIEYTGAAVEVYSSTVGQNAGLICNTLSSGTVIITDQFAAPASYSVKALEGHAGGIIGEMKQGTELTLNKSVVGATIVGKNDAGGVVGHAENAFITGSGSVGAVSVTAQEGSAGGLVGHLQYDNQEDSNNNSIQLNSLKVENPSLSSPAAIGGLYGTLKVGSKIRAKLVLSDGVTVCKGSENACTNYGGLIGSLKGSAAENGDVAILEIDGKGKTITSDGKSANTYQGGVIGCIGAENEPATVFIKDISLAESHPAGALTAFGGLSGKIEGKSIAALEGTIAVKVENNIERGGGLVGDMQPGSVLSLSGTTDLKDSSFAVSENVGQLVGSQDCALAFANGSGTDNGWSYIRSSQKGKIDDIGTYGQVIRLKCDNVSTASKLSSDLFKVCKPTEASAGKLVMKNYADTGYVITNEDDFALLSVLWQSHGMIKAENAPDYISLSQTTTTISLSEDIDLTGSGITGLTRDMKETESVFHGSFNGNSNSITLAIGEAYGYFANDSGNVPATNSEDGCGRIYRHNALGLFASADGSVSNLTIKGNIDVESYADQCYVGGIAGLIEGGKFTLSGVTVSEVILCGNDTKKAVYAGGFYGAVSKTSNITFGVDGDAVTSSAAIQVKDVHDGKYMCLGGLIGAIVGSDNESNITMKNVLLQKPGQQDIKLNLDGTSITDGQSFFAGGLIGAIVPYTSGKKKTLNIKQVTIDGYAMESNNTSENSISGGLLGSLWASTDVMFGEAGSTGDSFALSVVDGSNKANNVQYFGGMVYAASGKWTVNDHGIDLSGAKLSATAATSFGILVHDAYDGITPILGTSINRGGLYIELTAHWDKAYRLVESDVQKISIEVKNDIKSFDEFAAYTAGTDIWLSEKNGVISLHTDDSSNNGKLLMDGNNINSYVNRSEVGKTINMNSHSRYYYNLDRLYTEVNTTNNTNSSIDTNAELMLWSVCRYGATNLRNSFTVGDVSYDASVIGGTSESSKAAFDLNGYSYYPIDLLNMNLTVQNAEFKFYNQEIESGENKKSNKNTSTATQHKGMHCGLFRNFLRQSSAAATMTSYQLTAQKLKFSGTIGMLEAKSGALLCGKVEGNDKNGSNIYTVAASDILLNDLQVREMLQDSKPEYAPLLIAEPSSYSTTSVSRVRTEGYTAGQKAATSLIGKAGSSDAPQINLSFSEMNLPSKKDDTIFTCASFLESFQYKADGVGTAVYNFTKADQGNNRVTFGAEIDDTKEYVGVQLWYYDESGYGSDNNLVTDEEITASKGEAESNFNKKYLPYVYQPYPSGKNKQSDDYHEIEVNHRIVDILTGCGTYADPYVISDAMELETIASFLQSGAPRKNWRVTIAANQKEICSRRKDNSNLQDTVYICDGTNWNIDMENPPSGAKEQLKNNTILYYLLSAYYDIQDDLVLKDFIGLGSKDYGFRGVVTSTTNNKITLKGSNTSHGLIPYSYGAVVKNLKISYQKDEENGLVISSSEKDAFAPSAFFGGVIGVILGGDNIIDNVSVTMDKGFLSLTGDKPHLIQAGGYVGSICGGGVIFRNMTGKSGMENSWFGNTENWMPSTAGDAYKSLYVNPFIGRVLDGFAFSEKCTVDNTDKNYKINDIGEAERNSDGTLNSSKSIEGGTMLGNTKGGSLLTINDAVGLLAFSAILNSGASAGPAFDYKGTSAYAGGNVKYDDNYQFGNARYGKVRCAKYDNIGDPTNGEDFRVANKDDRTAPGLQGNGGSDIVTNLNSANADDVNLCYLVARFGDKYAMFAAVAYVSDVRYIFENTTYDMTAYGNGYQGIGCRYKANAGNNLAADAANYDRVVPWIRYVQGNGATIKASINVREYADDDFWTMGVGAVFGYTYFYNNSSLNNSNAVSNMTISDSTLSLKYYSGNGEEDTSGYSARKAGVGGFAGAQIGGYSIGTVKHVQVKDTKIEGGYHAGGIFGSIGKVAFTAGATGEHFVYPSDVKCTASFVDCGYQNLDVKGYFYSGGFVGEFYSKQGVENLIQGAIGSSEESVEEQGQSNTRSMIQSVGSVVQNNESKHQISAGGLVGHYISDTNGKLKIEGSGTNQSNTMTDVTLYAYGKAGGLIGWIQNTELIVKDTTVTSTVNPASITSDSIYEGTVNYSVVGGIIGRSQDCKLLLSSCYVTNMKIGNGKETAAGGLVGDSVVGTTVLETFNCGVESCQIQTGAVTGKSCYAGGLIGFLGSTWTGSNVLLTGSEVTDSTASGGTAYKGLLVGRMLDFSLSYAIQFSSARVAGISVQGLSADQLKVNEIGNQNRTLLDKCYFAYADYESAPVTPTGDLFDATAVRPYVVTSPVSPLCVQKNKNTYYLSGDGASWTEQSAESQEKFLPRAQTILEESQKTEADKFQYTRTGLSNFDFAQRFSTYWENQGIALSEGMNVTDLPTDFPVFQISGGNTGVITDYLNLLTNGGYDRACSLASGSVTAKTERYKWNEVSKVFEFSSEKASLRANDDHTFSVTREYDNGMNQFTLLTVTFTEQSSIDTTQSYSYKVQIPLIVRRVLEVDFTATLSYGANLNASAYDQVEHHVLDSFGNTISGYLTYSYNSVYGEYSEYGWQNFIDEGGDVAQRMEKTLVFKQQNTFPSGTQLTLIDEASGSVYYKTIEDSAKEISMNDFKAEDGITSYQSKTIGEIMKVTAAKASDGTFIEVDENGKPKEAASDAGPYEKPSAFLNGKYYRLAKADGTEKDCTKYKLTVNSVIGSNMPVENYYLIITIPKGDAALVNGQLETRLGGTIPHHINYKLRGKNAEDTHTNTASTYLISKGYQQTLEETLDSSLGVSQIIDGANRTLHVAVQSKITFPTDQVYQKYDALYQSFTANLQTVINTKTDAVKFPSQTAGTVSFYVTDGNGRYYSNPSSWESSSQDRKSIASYTWTSNGESMELLLSTKGTTETMINLQGMRDAMKNSGQDHFYVEAVLEAVIPAAGLDVIPESDSEGGLPENYAKLTYVSHLSTQKESLSYSSMKAVKTDTNISYYRKMDKANRFTYDADQIDQLGINLKDLQEEYLNEDGTCSRIETTARYNLSGVPNLENILRKSSGVRYTLNLRARGTEQSDLEYPQNHLSTGNAYIQLDSKNADYRYNSSSGTWSWTVGKDQYMNGDEVKIGSVFDGTSFIEKIPIWVRVDNVESTSHFYANYKLELRVEVIDSNGNILIGPDSDYLIYTLTKIQPEFVDET